MEVGGGIEKPSFNHQVVLDEEGSLAADLLRADGFDVQYVPFASDGEVVPALGAGDIDLTMGAGRSQVVVTPWALAAGIVILFAGIVAFARVNGFWHTSLPDATYFELIPRAASFVHPR